MISGPEVYVSVKWDVSDSSGHDVPCADRKGILTVVLLRSWTAFRLQVAIRILFQIREITCTAQEMQGS